MATLQETATQTEIARILFQKKGNPKAPAVIFFVGIHGNEPAGLEAFFEIDESLKECNFQGSLYVFSGNIKALCKGVRFIDRDLNRIWTHQQIATLKTSLEPFAEAKEQQELLRLIDEVIRYHSGPLYFVDFHTTSSKTMPFITINDALINRKFSEQFPVPIILGIEEYLEGPLLSYINERGFVSLGFESGQHEDREAVENAKAFMWLTLMFTRVIAQLPIAHSEEIFRQLRQTEEHRPCIYEVVERYEIHTGDDFVMVDGYKSFQAIKKGERLAYHNGKTIVCKKDSILFMPLYQAKGEEGFFRIRKTPRWALWLSEKLRKQKADGLLTVLPGVCWASRDKDVLKINLKTARFLAKPIFHLLGFRHRQQDSNQIKVYNRERAAQSERYRGQKWFE